MIIIADIIDNASAVKVLWCNLFKEKSISLRQLLPLVYLSIGRFGSL